MTDIDRSAKQNVIDVGLGYGEDSTFDRNFGGPIADILGFFSSSAQVTTGAAVFSGLECSSGAGVTVNVYNSTSSTGTAFFTRSVSSGNGYPAPSVQVYCPNGIFISPGTTALTVAVLGIVAST